MYNKEHNLDKLKRLTNNLVSFDEITKTRGKGYLELEMINGTALGWNLLHEKDISVDKWFVSKGSTFPNHVHEELEILTVFQGIMIMKIDGKEVELKKGSTYYITPNMEHSAHYPDDCFFITITIPCGEGFPK